MDVSQRVSLGTAGVSLGDLRQALAATAPSGARSLRGAAAPASPCLGCLEHRSPGITGSTTLSSPTVNSYLLRLPPLARLGFEDDRQPLFASGSCVFISPQLQRASSPRRAAQT